MATLLQPAAETGTPGSIPHGGGGRHRARRPTSNLPAERDRRSPPSRRPWRLLVGALLMLAVVAPLAAQAQRRMVSVQFAARAEAHLADQVLSDEFASGPPQVVVLVSAPSGTDDPRTATAVQAMTARWTAGGGVARVESYWTSRDPTLASADRRTGLVLLRLTGDEQAGISAAGRLLPMISGVTVAGLHLQATGSAVVAAAMNEQMEKDLVRAELITAPLAILVLLFVFGSLVAAALPLIMGALSVVGTLAVLTVLTHVVEVSAYSLNLATAIGIGLAVDYSLFVITRFREQLLAGDDVPAAVATAMSTAGRTVWFSAVTVALGFAAPLVFPSMRSLAYAGIVVSLIAAMVATTVLPAMLGVIGRRINRWNLLARWHRERRHAAPDSQFWHRLAAAVMRHPGYVVGSVAAVLLVLALPFGQANFGVQDDRALPVGHPVQEAGVHLRSQFPAADAAPFVVVLPRFSGNSSTLDAYADRLSALPSVVRVDTATGSFAHGNAIARASAGSAQFTDGRGVWLQVTGDVPPYSAQGRQLVEELRSTPAPAHQLVGGAAAGLVDTRAELLDRLPWALLIIAGATLVLLFLFTGGLLIPLKAIVLNLLSLTATFGAMIFVFQEGHLQWLVGTFTPTGYIDIGIPVLIFFVAFGLSMDYEIFLLSRIAEEHRASGDNTLAVARGLQRTGRLITAAATLMAVVLAAMATSGVSNLKLLGVGLALAVMLDATLVRALLVPAIMRLAGSANWWAPTWLRRVHRRFGLSDG